jgi:HAD superfamily hydrolase (TIGR01484 family)
LKPLAALDGGAVRAIVFDIDETLTTAGRLTAEAYGALQALKDAGKRTVAVTGRPAGWCDHIARMWPVDGVVGENGAFYFVYDRARRTMRQRFFTDAETMAANRGRLEALAKLILAAVPGSALASDQPYRIADLAIDFCEDVPPLPDNEVDRIVSLFREHGAQAKVSSIHVNGWFGNYDKLSMARVMLQDEFGLSLEAAGNRMLFVGDSPNDEPMFGAFPLSVGVANIGALAHRIAAKPRYVTHGRSGEGFVELTDRIVAARGSRRGD